MNKELSSGTTVDSSTKADGNSVSPTCSKPNVMRRFALFFIKLLTVRNVGFAFFLWAIIGSIFTKMDWGLWIFMYVAFAWFELCNISDELKKKITIGNITVRPKESHIHIYKNDKEESVSENGA